MQRRQNDFMRHDIDHLPERQRQELERVVDTLLVEFDKATASSTQPSRRNGSVLKIILFGSYARDDWVDEPENGYQSDFDLLVIVSHPDLTDVANYWFAAEDHIERDPTIRRPVNTIVHSLDDVNRALGRGEYFWVDIVRDGIGLYEIAGTKLATPQPLNSADAYEMAALHFSGKLGDVDRWLRTAAFQSGESLSDKGFAKLVAFNLHQAAETAYACFLLVRTLYFPRSHNIRFLRSLAEESESRLIEAWPRATRVERRRFELLKRAYVEARYSDSYEISSEDLEAITVSVRKLRDIVEAVCREHLEDLKAKAGL